MIPNYNSSFASFYLSEALFGVTYPGVIQVNFNENDAQPYKIRILRFLLTMKRPYIIILDGRNIDNMLIFNIIIKM